MPCQTLEPRASTRGLTFDDEMRELLRQEAHWFCASIGDHIEHAVDRFDDESATETLFKEAERIKVAIVVCSAAEHGRLSPVHAGYLPQIVAMIEQARDEYRATLADDRDSLQRFIVRGTEDGYGFPECDRGDSISLYHHNIESARRSAEGCERFLELVGG